MDGLSYFHDSYASLRLIPPRIMASNVTSQFQLLVLHESTGKVEVQRSGRGWGRDLTVAAVVFEVESAFTAFLEMGSFSEVKKYLALSVLHQKEMVFRGDSQVPILSPYE